MGGLQRHGERRAEVEIGVASVKGFADDLDTDRHLVLPRLWRLAHVGDDPLAADPGELSTREQLGPQILADSSDVEEPDVQLVAYGSGTSSALLILSGVERHGQPESIERQSGRRVTPEQSIRAELQQGMDRY